MCTDGDNDVDNVKTRAAIVMDHNVSLVTKSVDKDNSNGVGAVTSGGLKQSNSDSINVAASMMKYAPRPPGTPCPARCVSARRRRYVSYKK